MSRSNRTDELNKLRALQDKILREKEVEARSARLSALLVLAKAAMNEKRAETWGNKHGNVDAAKKSELEQRVKETREAFVKGFRETVGNDPRMRRWWGAELQKAVIQGAPEALLMHYLSAEGPEKTKALSYSLKKAADDYVRGWELLGKKERKELSGPLDRVGNSALAVQIVIEQLKAGDEIQKAQGQILEILFEDPIAALGQKNPKPEGFSLGETLGAKDQGSAE